MKKNALLLTFIASFSQADQNGILINFMQETNDSLPLPSAESIAATTTILGAATYGGLTALQKSSLLPITKELQTRSVAFSLSSALFSSPVLWTAFGGCIVAFGVNYFIEHEMALIIETKKTLKALEKEIKVWQLELPQLKENQENTAEKVKKALTVLDTITPLVIKLAKNSETAGAAQKITAIQKELAELKTTVQSLTTAQGNETAKIIAKKSYSIFGLAKKKYKNNHA